MSQSFLFPLHNYLTFIDASLTQDALKFLPCSNLIGMWPGTVSLTFFPVEICSSISIHRFYQISIFFSAIVSSNIFLLSYFSHLETFALLSQILMLCVSEIDYV